MALEPLFTYADRTTPERSGLEKKRNTTSAHKIAPRSRGEYVENTLSSFMTAGWVINKQSNKIRHFNIQSLTLCLKSVTINLLRDNKLQQLNTIHIIQYIYTNK